MTCREVTGYLLEYTAGELDAEDRAELDAHTAGCDNCREFLREYQQTIAACQAAFADLDAGAGATAAAGLPDETIAAAIAAMTRQA
jgi:anti-sigma factor RsiW